MFNKLSNMIKFISSNLDLSSVKYNMCDKVLL